MNKKTVTIGIGNSDDKLSQLEWSSFCAAVNSLVNEYAIETHFYGHSVPTTIWQNACFVFEIYESNIGIMKSHLQQIRANYGQKGAAWIEGKTESI